MPSFEKFEDLQDLHLVRTNDSVQSSSRTAAEKLVGTVIEHRYQLLDLIGEGGMGFVFKAIQLTTGRLVAIKMIASENISTEQILRFCQEAKAACAFSHPNAVAIYELFISNGTTPYLAMQYVEGITLADEIERNGPLAEAEATQIFSQVADALAHAHQSHVLHRDIKPSNIMLVNDMRGHRAAMLLDFGIAKLASEDGKSLTLTKTGEVVGTPHYMSPEQCQGKEADPRSDIYALGCVMYEALTGEKAVIGGNFLQVLANQVHDTIKPMSEHDAAKNISPRMKNIIHKAIEKDPNKRFQSMTELWQVLLGRDAVPTGRSVVAAPDDRLQLSKLVSLQPLQSVPLKVGVLSLVTVGLIVAIALFIYLNCQPLARPIILSQGSQKQFANAMSEYHKRKFDVAKPKLEHAIVQIVSEVSPSDDHSEDPNLVYENVTSALRDNSTNYDLWALGVGLERSRKDLDLNEKVALTRAAVAAFDTGLQSHPLDSPLNHERAVGWQMLASDLQNNNDDNDALLYYRTAVKYDQDEIARQEHNSGNDVNDLYVHVADAYREMGNIEKNNQQGDVLRQIRAYYDFNKATDWYAKAEPLILRDHPGWADDGEFYLSHASALQSLGRTKEAEEMRAKAKDYAAKHGKSSGLSTKP